MKWEQELKLATKTAKEAGCRLKEIKANHAVQVLDGCGRDLKIKADRESEAYILGSLKAATPYPILAEETGGPDSYDDSGPLWIVDPLDGTLNYSRGLPLFSVSIALWQGEHPALGVVYDIRHDELFSGVVGTGAWCNREPITVSAVEKTNQAILATGFPVNRDFDSAPLQRFIKQVQDFKKVRLLGSAALSLAYLACGRVDAYMEEDIMLWDVAAGMALVKAAGGWVSVRRSDRKKWARNVICAVDKSLAIV
jgi:myo-inositol-1(or 4)-monophosphatase